MTNRQIWPDDYQPVELLQFEPLETRYLKLKRVSIAIAYVVLMALALLILLIDEDWALTLLIVVESFFLFAFGVNIAIAPKIWDIRGYALRDKDISYRSGLFFRKVATIPFAKIQQVSVGANPLGRLFNLYYIDIINGSQGLSGQIMIPGLTREKAEKIKSLVICKTESDDE